MGGDINNRWWGRYIEAVIQILTYQDFLAAKDRIEFIRKAINEHRESEKFKRAVDAEAYDRQQNVTINAVVRTIYTAAGIKVNDPTTSNNKIASNFFHRLNTQRVSYLLGNGVSFVDHVTYDKSEDGETVRVDETKEKLGDDFDTKVYDVVYSGEISCSSYCYVTYDSKNGYGFHLFKYTEFVPLLDEVDGTLRAGIRFWSLDWDKKPVTVVLYEKDGITRFRTKPDSKGLDLVILEQKHKYNTITVTTEAYGTEVIGDENHFSDLPIIPYYAKNEISTLEGMQSAIDSYDLIQSGFANDLQDCAQIYWLVGGSLGMDDENLKKFRERLLFQHIGVADLDNSSVTPYTQQVPYEARVAYLRHIRNSIYEAFGALDVTNINTGDRTATEIEAAYQALEEEADALEARVTDFIRRLLKLLKIEDVPQYKRNRISNQLEQTQMIVMAAEHLSERAILEKLPWVTVDEIDKILAERGAEIDELSEENDLEGDTTLQDGDML